MTTQIQLSALLSLGFGIISVTFTFIAAKVVGKYFDQVLLERNLPLPPNYAFTAPDICGRAIAYCVYIIKGAAGKRGPFAHLYKDINFRQLARKIDVQLAWANFVCILLFFICLIWLFTGPHFYITFTY